MLVDEQIDFAQVLVGDCRTLLSALPQDRVAIITDPPYGMNAKFTRQGARKASSLSCATPLMRRGRDWRPIIGDDEPFNPVHLLSYPIVALFGADHYCDQLSRNRKWLFWDKRNGSPSDNNSDGELIWTNLQGALRVHSQKWRGIVREGEENLSRSHKLHPAQKPVSLMRWVIGQCKVPPDFTIVDPYAGSGSTCVAAAQLGYRTVGIEMDPEWAAIAADRLRQRSLLT